VNAPDSPDEKRLARVLAFVIRPRKIREARLRAEADAHQKNEARAWNDRPRREK
jgi:hypothetical protein